MGREASPARLFYGFSLDEHVPGDHLLRQVDAFVDLKSIRQDLKPYYSRVGRPSIDPELMIRMLIIGYCLGIRSERRLCDEVHLNLAYRWFCVLDWMAGCRTIRRFRAIAMAAFVRVIVFGACSRRSCSFVLMKGLLAVKALPHVNSNRGQPDPGRCQQAAFCSRQRMGSR